MKIFDMHIHMGYTEPQADIIECMDKAGVYGGCVFSAPPKNYRENIGKDFDKRLDEVLEFTKPYKDRLFSILWIHPDEENILEKIEIAVNRGIDGFKIICNNFYVYEEKCLKLLYKIAQLNKPVIFHSGILWDGNVSSSFNRPVNWESLLRIKGLRFSMGHCSWPWHDECIAMYGKFANALITGETAEMFLDITPGTPEIYREDLLTKLFCIGYDLGNNILFGTDCRAEDYNISWAQKWLDIDNKIMDKLGVRESVREDLYYNNLMYFLGKSKRTHERLIPTPDNSNMWNPFKKSV